jgi:hypothetical protein
MERQLRLRHRPWTARGQGRAAGREREPERARRAVPVARQAPPAQRRRAPRPRPGSLPTQRPGSPAAPRAGAPRPPGPGRPPGPPGRLKVPGVLAVCGTQPTARRAGFRRFRRRPRPGPDPNLDPNRGPQGVRALPGRPGSRDRRGLRPPRRISGGLGPGRLVPRRLGPPGRAARGLRVVRGRGPPRLGRRDLALPVPVPPGRADLARPVPAPRDPARGRVITRSARPRPAWDRRHRPGPRVRFPASLVARGSRLAVRAVPGRPAVRVPRPAGRAGPASRMDRVLAVRVLAAPGPAR